MRVDFFGQSAGHSPLSDQLNRLLMDEKLDHLRFLVAFARWSGLHLIDDALQRFTNAGNTVDGIVGVDLGGTTIEALTYLSELPGATIRIVRSGRPFVVFHPKVFIFSGKRRWVTIVGSSNLTTGGLFTNFEAMTMLSGSRGETNPLDDYWNLFDEPRPPLRPEHLTTVDPDVLADLAPRLDHYTKPPPDRAKRVIPFEPDIPPIQLGRVIPHPGRPPSPAQRRIHRRPRKSTSRSRIDVVHTGATAPAGRGELYMELWDETGGGTQVQISKEAFTDFFGGDKRAVTYVSLSTPIGADSVRLQEFANSTWRIPLRFVASIAVPHRRAVLRFVRTGRDAYRVSVKNHGEAGYLDWLNKCTKGRPGAKRYGLY